MLKTPLCDLLGVDVPIICAPFGPWNQVDLAAAVCEVGGLGSVPGSGGSRCVSNGKRCAHSPIARSPSTHTARPFNPVFDQILDFGPAVVGVSFGRSGRLGGARARRRGRIVDAAGDERRTSASRGRSRCRCDHRPRLQEAGGARRRRQPHGPCSAGPRHRWLNPRSSPPAGIADGRGLAAALAMGAQAVNMGTRFVASSRDSPSSDNWKKMILDAGPEDTGANRCAQANHAALHHGHAVARQGRRAAHRSWQNGTAAPTNWPTALTNSAQK